MKAVEIAPARKRYAGEVTKPERWSCWTPREGDVLVCTPPKCGTTWTQTILMMLIEGGPDLAGPVPVLSPWVDADLGVSADKVTKGLKDQPGRRVVKTHTPADGFPVWRGIPVIAVYRHPLDVFFSLRKHVQNQAKDNAEHPMLQGLDQSFASYVDNPCDTDDFDLDTLAGFVLHFSRTVLNADRTDVAFFHYADMRSDPRGCIAAMAQAAGINASEALLDTVAEATAFDAMRSRAEMFTPVAGTGFWKDDKAFFHSATSRKWDGKLTASQLSHYRDRLAELIPDKTARLWLEEGGARP